MGSTSEGKLDSKEVMQWILNPISLETFFSDYWEKKPLHIKRNDPGFYSQLFTKNQLNQILISFGQENQKRDLTYEGNMNICICHQGQKHKIPLKGKISAAKVWKHYNQGCTVQFFQPQRFSAGLKALLRHFESFFGCLVGSSCYLTPMKSQGLAPHHDDVEVFILQLEGSKTWALHKPLVELPRSYSRDLSAEEIGEEWMTIKMEQGDLLYFPRGTIHYAKTSMDESHHVTISTYQKNSWYDFLMAAFPLALNNALKSESKLRTGLPVNFGEYMGYGKEKKKEKAKEREQFEKTFKELFNNIQKYASPHTTSDNYLLDFVTNRLPPSGVKNISATQQLSDKSRIRFKEINALKLVIEEISLIEQDGNSEEEESIYEIMNGGYGDGMDYEDEDEDDEEGNEDEEDDDMEEVVNDHGLRFLMGPIADEEEDEDEEDEDYIEDEEGQNSNETLRERLTRDFRDAMLEENEEDEEMEETRELELEQKGKYPMEKEEKCYVLYHSNKNKQSKHMISTNEAPHSIKFPPSVGEAFTLLFEKFPKSIVLDELPLPSQEEKIGFASLLLQEGILEIV